MEKNDKDKPVERKTVLQIIGEERNGITSKMKVKHLALLLLRDITKLSTISLGGGRSHGKKADEMKKTPTYLGDLYLMMGFTSKRSMVV